MPVYQYFIQYNREISPGFRHYLQSVQVVQRHQDGWGTSEIQEGLWTEAYDFHH